MRLLLDGRSLGDVHGGLARYTRSILNALAAHGAIKDMIILGEQRSIAASVNDRFNVRMLQLDSESESLSAQSQWHRAIRTTKPTLVFAPFHIGAPWRCSVPLVVMVHDLIWQVSSPGPWSRARRELISRLAIRNSSGVLVPSAATGAQLSGAPKPLRVVPHAVDDVFRCSTERPDDGSGRREILIIGSPRPHKRVSLIREVVPLLRVTEPEVSVVLVSRHAMEFGLSWRLPALEDIVEVRVNLSDQELAAEYRQASVVVVMSSVEGFSFPILEAVASGTPVVASDIPVHRELALPNVSYVDTEEAEAWADAILEAIRADSRPPSEVSSQLLCRRWSDVADETIDFFREVLAA